MRRTFRLISPHSAADSQTVLQRIVLYANEFYRVPDTYRKLRVVTGTAFVTQAARDLILGPGHETELDRGKDVALISPLRSTEVIVELLDGLE